MPFTRPSPSVSLPLDAAESGGLAATNAAATSGESAIHLSSHLLHSSSRPRSRSPVPPMPSYRSLLVLSLTAPTVTLTEPYESLTRDIDLGKNV